MHGLEYINPSIPWCTTYLAYTFVPKDIKTHLMGQWLNIKIQVLFILNRPVDLEF